MQINKGQGSFLLPPRPPLHRKACCTSNAHCTKFTAMPCDGWGPRRSKIRRIQQLQEAITVRLVQSIHGTSRFPGNFDMSDPR